MHAFVILVSSSWSSMLAVINKIHWCVAVCTANCTVDRRNCWSHCSINRCMDIRSDSIRRELRFLPSLSAFDAPIRGPRRNIAITFGIKKKLTVWLPDGEKICLFISTEYTNVTDKRTDRQTDTAWRHRPRLCIASRGKNCTNVTAIRRRFASSFLYGQPRKRLNEAIKRRW